MESLFFSVVIPVYNKAAHLDRSIKSVLNQTFTDFEIIIIDDASTDNSLAEINKFNDPRIRVFQRDEPGPGGYAARNLGIRKSNGKWICFLDADDSWKQNYLQKYSNSIQKFNDVNIFTSSWKQKNNNSEKPAKVYHRLKKGVSHQITYLKYLNLVVCKCSPIWTSVTVVNRESLLKSEMFPEGNCKQGGDVDTWLRLIYQENKMVHINELLATYHRDSINMVTKKYPDLSLGCIVPTCSRLIEKAETQEEITLLKKFSNRFLLSTIRRNIISNRDYSDLIKYFHKNVNPLFYLFIIASNFKPFKNVAKMYFERRKF